MNILQKVIYNPRKALNTAINHASLGAFDHADYKRFIVLARSRVGSNLLLTFLNSHPNITTKGEIFAKIKDRHHKDMLTTFFNKQPYHVKARGFKIFYYHPLDANNDVWTDLVNMENLCIIHLKRQNILRTLISRKIAGVYGVWFSTSSNNAPRSISFTVEELERLFRQTRAWETASDEMFRHHSPLTIYYEDMIAETEDCFRLITNLLGVREIKPKTMLKKQNSARLHESVTNYDELKSAFAGSEWQVFFDE